MEIRETLSDKAHLTNIEQLIIDNKMANIICSNNKIRFEDYCEQEEDIILLKLLNLPKINIRNVYTVILSNDNTIKLKCAAIYNKGRRFEQIMYRDYNITNNNEILNIIDYHRKLVRSAKEYINQSRQVLDTGEPLREYLKKIAVK